MLCQFCGKNEATNKFHVNFMGLNRDVFLCDECLSNFQGNGNQAAWPLSFSVQGGNMQGSKERELGSDPFNVDAGRDIKMKRKLNQLHKQLSNAVEAERYEDAAELRDKINDIKKEVYINGK